MDIRLFTRFLFLSFFLLFSSNSYSINSIIKPSEVYGCFKDGVNYGYFIKPEQCAHVFPFKNSYIWLGASYPLQNISPPYFIFPYSYVDVNLLPQHDPQRKKVNIGLSSLVRNICPSSHPTDNGDGTCSNNEPPTCTESEVLDPSTNTCVPAPTCPAEGTKDKSSYGPPNLLGFSACTANNCIIQVGTTDGLSLCTGGGTADEQCAYTTYYTGQACTYNPDNTTWNPPGHEWPEVPKPDLPVPDQPDLPLPDSGGGNGGYDPDAGIEDNFTPPNPDTSPDADNPNLGAEGNAGVVNELNSANKSLQNIEAILTQTRKDQNENAATQERYNSGILGAINSIDKSVSGASGSGGGGGGGNGDGDSGSGCDPEKEQCESGLNFGRPEVKDPFENILDASDIAEVQAKTTDIKTSLKSKIDEIKNLISVPKYETGGSVPAVEFSLQHGDSNIQVKNDALSRISPDIANIITLVVAVICFGIVAARR
ncbi:hypothetical protein DYC75_06915 [Vibrio cholerae]|nr:hypothetical protein [Vibrio cholerae]